MSLSPYGYSWPPSLPQVAVELPVLTSFVRVNHFLLILAPYVFHKKCKRIDYQAG